MADNDYDKIFRMERVKGGEHTVTKAVKKEKEITTIVTDQVLTVKDPKTGLERSKHVKVDRVIENGVSQWYVHKPAWQIDRADVIIDLADYHLQLFGLVHGGVIATAIDTATFWSAFLRLPEDAGLVNVDLKLNYLQPVVEGRLITRGTCLRPGRAISYAEAKVFDQDEKLIAHGTSTLMVLPGKGLKLNVSKFIGQ